ncbi:MAG: FkbM family methyltransferase [Sphingobacteriaceae bacterium]|nr:MAG: FkbM family methyltransferase [Sphingobacteriaceae bacterium]
MKRKDQIKLNFTRNWGLPGKERLANWLKPSATLKANLKNGIVWLNKEDIAIYTTADNYIEWSILSTGTYEEEINKLIKISLTAGDNAIDIGGNIGLQSLRMSGCVGHNGKVVAFEPLNYLQEKFKKNITLNKANNVTLLPFALSDQPSELELTINNDEWNQGTFSLSNKDTGNNKQRVVVKVGDDIPEIQSLNSLALIKIDVEGFEFHVLKGLKQTLEKHKPRIIFEYDSNYWRDTGQSMADCYTFLRKLNYSLYQISIVGCELINGVDTIESGNLFCIAN